MTRVSPLDLLNRMFEAEFAYMQSEDRNPALLAQSFHADVVIHEPASLPYAGDWHGLTGAGQLFQAMAEIWSDLQVRNLQAARTGDDLFMSCDLTLTSRATGRRVSQPFAEVLVFRDDLLIDGTPFYFDTVELLATIAP